MTVRAAFISGPMYDALYQRLAAFSASTGIDVEIAYQGDRPALNEHLASLPSVPYDLVSTHEVRPIATFLPGAARWHVSGG